MPDHLNDLSDDLLDAYLAGTLSDEAAERVRVYLDAHPGRRGVIAGVRATLRVSEYAEAHWPTPDVAAERLLDRLGKTDFLSADAANAGSQNTHSQSATRSGPTPAPIRKIMAWAMVGACVCVCIGIGAWLSIRYTRDTRATNNMAQRFTTAPGQRTTVHLHDGSTVTLAPATSLAITNRGAEITGEAYFTIAPHPTRPFIIRTTNTVVHVLGTRFSVRQYPDESRSRVVVEDGRVAVSPMQAGNADPHRRAILASRMLAFVTDSGVTVTSGVATQSYTSWTHGTLVFDRVALGDIAVELARAYDADIRIADTMLAKQTMQLDVSVTEQSLPQVLTWICLASNAHYTRAGRTFVLAPGRTARQTSPPASERRTFPQPEQQYGR